MKLAVDIGNSRVKWAEIDNSDKLSASSYFERGEPVATVLDAAWSDLEAPTRVLVSSVAGSSFDARVEEWIVEQWRCCPSWFLSEPETLGIVNGYTDYTHLGSDRWAALIGARGCFAGAVGVIDCGTAITVDVVDEADRHLGGWIFPGLELSRQNLLTNTAKIREMTDESSTSLGRSTAVCVANGTMLGLAGALERWMATVENQLDSVTWIATGGDWPRLRLMMQRPIRYDAHLVLRGLARVLA